VGWLSNFAEVGTDVFMHFLASADMRYQTVQNYDFDHGRRDRTPDSQGLAPELAHSRHGHV
jgi:hypothetical protein